jgi:NAD(P)-dependent dehydrogenase (short-subunit alcohol dehydrogenase family)
VAARAGAPSSPSIWTNWRTGIEAKLFVQLTVAQSSLGKLKPEGSLTFVSAGSARVPIPGTSGLAAINGAIEAMVPTLAKELAPLRVNAVSPGVIDTPWWNGIPRRRAMPFSSRRRRSFRCIVSGGPRTWREQSHS